MSNQAIRFVKLLLFPIIIVFTLIFACGHSEKMTVVNASVAKAIEATNSISTAKLNFEDDLAIEIQQSVPTNGNTPLGLSASLDVEYLGAFRALSGGESSSNYAVGTLAYNQDNNSIYLAGHAHHNAIAEFQVPAELSKQERPKDIVQAAVLQKYVKVLDKKQVGQDTDKITGILYYKHQLLVTSEIWYDGNGRNMDNLQVFENANNLQASKYIGMLQLDGGAKAAGYMAKIPKELQDKLGGEYYTGWASNYSITSRYSQGPSLYTFEPEDAIGAKTTDDRSIATQVKMMFPFNPRHPLVAGGDKAKKDISPLWGPMARAKYGFIIPNTNIFMLVGSHGGLHSGIGYKIRQDTGRVCGGYCTYEASDSYNYFWLFNIDDIVNAKQPWMVKPFSYGKWSHPYDNGGKRKIIGATYDIESRRLFLSISGAGRIAKYDRPPLILTYKIAAKGHLGATE